MKRLFNPRLIKSVKPGKKKKQLLFYNPSKKRSLVFGIGTGVSILAFIYVIYLYFPLLESFGVYQWFKLFRKGELVRRIDIPVEEIGPTPTLPPVPDPSFSIVIPKINAEAKITANTDPGNPEIYQEVLKEGVAHAAGSGFPGSGKTIYLFAHSTNSQWNIVRYNAVFFWLNNLEEKDEIWVAYNNKLHVYEVFDKKIVDPTEVQFLTDYKDGETLILQTCWPPGTILKRLLVFAKPKR